MSREMVRIEECGKFVYSHRERRSLTGLPEGAAFLVRAAEGHEFSHPE